MEGATLARSLRSGQSGSTFNPSFSPRGAELATGTAGDGGGEGRGAVTTRMADETSPPVPRDGKRAVAVPVNGCSATPAPSADDSYREMKRQRPGAPGDQPALAGQSGCGVPAKSTDVSAAEAQAHATHAPEIVQQSRAAGGLPPPMTAVEALAQAEAEGLTLARSSASKSGFHNVTVHPERKARPYRVRVWCDGKQICIGYFATAEEAALHIARTPEAQALAEAQPKAEAKAQAKAGAKTQAQAKAQAKA